MRKVKISEYHQLQNEDGSSVFCPIKKGVVPCSDDCAWFHILYIYEAGTNATRHYNCGDKLIGELIDAG